jgi:hypothetical protein
MDINYDSEEKAAERVAIAQDALAWVEAGALIPAKGAYVLSVNGISDTDFGKQLRDVVLGKCQVCARGALFLAKAVRFDNVIAEWRFSTEAANRWALMEHFSPSQIDLIEEYFEGFVRNPQANNWAVSLWENHSERMTLILQNIIANNGTFVPEKL